MPVEQLTAKELQQKIQHGEELFLLDVREPYEYRVARIEGSVSLPMAQVPNRLDELPANRPIVVICHHGMRSQRVADYLAHHDFEIIYNLYGGIDAWSREVDASVPRY